MSLFWDHVPHASLGILDVPFVAGDDVDMNMEDALPGRRSHINADIVPIRIELLIEVFFFFFDEPHAGSHFFRCQVEKAGDMPARDDQGVSRTRRVGVTSTVSKFMLYRYAAWIFAKQARIIRIPFLFLRSFRCQLNTSFYTLYSDAESC